MYNDLSHASKTILKTALEKQANPWEQLARLARDRRTLDYGVPAAVGLGTTGYELSQGKDLTTSGAMGLGAGLLSSPAGWRNVHNRAMADPNYLGEFAAGTGKMLATKGAPLAVAAGVNYLPDMLREGRDSIHNVATTTGALANQAPQIAQNVANTTGNVAETTKNVADQSKGLMTNINNATGNINNVAQGMGQFWDPQHGTIKDVMDRLDRMNENVNQLGQGGNRAADAVSNVAGRVGGVADRISGGMDWLGNHKGAIGLGAGGIGAALLLHKLLSRDKKKHSNL